MGIEQIEDYGIREGDDYFVILHKKSDIFYTSQFHYNDLDNIIEDELDDLSSDRPIKIKFSDFDSNVFFVSTGKDFQIRFLSYPKKSAGNISPTDMLFLRDYIYSTTQEKFGKIKIKWNSNGMPSNSLNVLSFQTKTYGDYIYAIIHNVGRIYTIREKLSEFYTNLIDPNLEKKFNSIKCSKSSIGLQLNSSFKLLIEDVVTLHWYTM